MRSINLRSSVIASMLLVLAVFLCQCTQAQKKSDYPVVSPVAIQPGKPLQQVPLLPLRHLDRYWVLPLRVTLHLHPRPAAQGPQGEPPSGASAHEASVRCQQREEQHC